MNFHNAIKCPAVCVDVYCFVTGEVITCLENAEALQALDLNDLSVTLDIFVLTLPLEIEGMQSDLRHNR